MTTESDDPSANKVSEAVNRWMREADELSALGSWETHLVLVGLAHALRAVLHARKQSPLMRQVLIETVMKLGVDD